MRQIDCTNYAMSNFYIRKYDYPLFYPYLGVRVRGAIRGVAVFKHYWYGMRVDPLHYLYNPRTPDQQFWRAYMAKGVYNWQYFSPETKDSYDKARYPSKMTGYTRYLKKDLKAQAQYRT